MLLKTDCNRSRHPVKISDSKKFVFNGSGPGWSCHFEGRTNEDNCSTMSRAVTRCYTAILKIEFK